MRRDQIHSCRCRPHRLLLATAAQAPANPWFGTWKLRLKTPAEKPETLIYSDAGNGAMRMVSVEDDNILVTRFDGEPAADARTEAGRNRSLAITASSPTRYTWTYSVAGQPRARGINTLATDLKTFTEVTWAIANPGKTITLIYERQ